MKKKLTLLILYLFCLVLPAAGQTPGSNTSASLDRYIEEARRDWEVPGIAVAIVKDGKIVLSKGYGVKKAGTSEPVDERTLFAIASNTKAFTASALAILVDEKKLHWDDPVRKHLPDFELYSPYVSSEIRIVDLLCHRSGLGTYSGDLIWYGTEYSAEEVIKRVRFLPPSGSFRKDFGYSNLMFIAAGLVIEKISGLSWSEFIRTRIFEPLRMRQSLTSPTQLEKRSNAATPHAYKKGTHKVYPWRPWDACAAAAGIISNLEDMTQWISLQLANGRWEDRSILSEDSINKLRTVHLSLPVNRTPDSLHPSIHFLGYGLGWALSDYLGKKVVSHGGAYDGMFSRVTLVPEEELGIVILTNSTTTLQTALTYRILDSFLNEKDTEAPLRDWSEIYLVRFRENRSSWEKQVAEKLSPRLSGTNPSLELEKYTGLFGGPFYGDGEVKIENGKLVVRLLPAKELIGDLEHLHLDTFRVDWRNDFPWFESGTVTFRIDKQANVTGFEIDVPNEDFWFTELEFTRKLP